jgi:hypothetical protein
MVNQPNEMIFFFEKRTQQKKWSSSRQTMETEAAQQMPTKTRFIIDYPPIVNPMLVLASVPVNEQLKLSVAGIISI